VAIQSSIRVCLYWLSDRGFMPLIGRTFQPSLLCDVLTPEESNSKNNEETATVSVRHDSAWITTILISK